MIRALCLLLAMLAFTGAAVAHERSRSNSIWTETTEGLDFLFYLEARQATLFLAISDSGTSLEAAFQQRLIDGLRVQRGDQACALASPPRVRLRPDGRLEGRGHWGCPEAGPVSIEVRVFSPLSANHIHFIRFETDDGIAERVLARGRPMADFGSGAAHSPAGWTAFLALGFEHILGGPDHVAFVLGLMLLVSGWRRLTMVTLGFTLGHSATLALAVLGHVSPPGAAIESLIGFSILFIAAEAALTQSAEFRLAGWGSGVLLLGLAILSALSGGWITWPVWLGLVVMTVFYFHWIGSGGRIDVAAPFLSAGFGLVHGVGFAGILLEIDISRDQLLPSLLAFNVGVELGQLAIVIAGLALVALLGLFAPQRFLGWGRAVLIGGLAWVGTFWFLGRAFG